MSIFRMTKRSDKRLRHRIRVNRGFFIMVVMTLQVITGCSTDPAGPTPVILSEQSVYVINTLGETLSVIDIEENTVDKNVMEIGLWSNQIVIHGSRAFVVNSGDNEIQIIDLENMENVKILDTGPGSNPLQIALSVDGKKAYITCWLANELVIFDTDSGILMKRLPLTTQSPTGVIAGESGLYVSCVDFNPVDFTYGDGKIYEVDTITNSVIDSLETFPNPQVMAFDSSGGIHVCCTGNYFDVSGKVVVIDPLNFTYADTVEIGGSPGCIVINSSGIAYLSSFSGGVYCYDVDSGEILRGSENPIDVGTGASGLALDPDDAVYICVMDEDLVKKLSNDWEITETYSVGDGPLSIAYFAGNF